MASPARGAALAGLHRSSSASVLISVLPAPLAPSTPTRLPARTISVTSRRMGGVAGRVCSRRTGVPASAADPAPDRARNADIDAGLGLQRCQYLHARQGLTRLCACLALDALAEAVDEALAGGRPRAVGVRRRCCPGAGARRAASVVVSRHGSAPAWHGRNAGWFATASRELGVGDQHHRAGIGRQPFLQPQHGVQVQVVWVRPAAAVGRRHQRARQRQARASRRRNSARAASIPAA